MSKKRLGFFTRLLDDVPAADRYRLAEEQIVHAEALGFDSAWVAQHHFNPHEGGLPSPLVFLSHVAARTSRIRLGTAILTLPLEQPLRVAEDAVVLDLLSGGRFEFGLGSGGTNSSFPPFGFDPANRGTIYGAHFQTRVDALEGRALGDAGQRLYPDDVIESLKADTVLDRVTDLIFQVHPVDPNHKFVLRSLELLAEKVAPGLGWTPSEVAYAR